MTSDNDIPGQMNSELTDAIDVLNRGGLIAYPTEGVYGIGCNAHDCDAIKRVLDIKKRDAAKGLILCCSDLSQLAAFIEPLTELEQQRVLPTWPGPTTWIVRAQADVSALLSGGRTTLAVRVSAHPVTSALCKICNFPLVSTSANLSGEPPCLSASESRERLGALVDYVVDAPLGGHSGPTPIYDARTGKQLR